MTDGSHRKQIQTETLPVDHEYDWTLKIIHKEDGIATSHGLTFEQAAMLHGWLDDIIDELDDDFQLKEKVIEEPAAGDGRGYE